MGKRPPAGPSCRQTRSSVFAIFATTKAITGTAVMQPVEENKLDLDAPAKTYAPHIGELQVLDGFDAGGAPKLRAALMSPLLFDPGDKWEYGSNIDWCGQVIEGTGFMRRSANT